MKISFPFWAYFIKHDVPHASTSHTGPWLVTTLLNSNPLSWVACSFYVVHDWLLPADILVQLVYIILKGNFNLITAQPKNSHYSTLNNPIKVPSPIIQNWGFIVCWESLLHRSKLKISVKSVKPFGCRKQFCKLRLLILYSVSLIMVTITSHIFTAF